LIVLTAPQAELETIKDRGPISEVLGEPSSSGYSLEACIAVEHAISLLQPSNTHDTSNAILQREHLGGTAICSSLSEFCNYALPHTKSRLIEHAQIAFIRFSKPCNLKWGHHNQEVHSIEVDRIFLQISPVDRAGDDLRIKDVVSRISHDPEVLNLFCTASDKELASLFERLF